MALIDTTLYGDGNLTHYWELEDVNATTGGVTLTNNNTVAFNAAKFGNGADLGASNTNKSLTTTNTLGIDGGAVSVSLWVKLQTEIGADSYYFFMQGNNTSDTLYRVTYEYNSGTRRLVCQRGKGGVGNDTVTHNVTLGTTEFHHIVLTYDTTTLRLYYDGVEVGDTAASGNGSSDVGNGLGIGADNAGSTVASAIIDDFAVFSDELTAGEVAILYTDIATDLTYSYFM